MTKEKTEQSFKNVLTGYISEVIIIFIGISISFLFDEWRENRKDDETAQKHLAVLRSNLIQDTLQLTGMIEIGKKSVRSTNKLAYFKLDAEIADSLDFYIDNAASYLNFKSNQTAYEEIKQTAHTNLIKNDSLKRAFLSYYTLAVPYCDEWCEVDKTQTMTQLIPEMTTYFPVVADSANIVPSKEKIQSLRTRKLRNLLLTNAAYKQETIKIFAFTKEVCKSLLRRVDGELERD